MTGRARRPPRPRDLAGRPLPYGAPGAPPVPPAPVDDPVAALALAQRLLDEGRPFAAHEVLEEVWKAAALDRELWRGLAQLAVGLTHAQRGNARGAVALLGRAADGLTESGTDGPAGTDPAALARWARGLAAELAAGAPYDGRVPRLASG